MAKNKNVPGVLFSEFSIWISQNRISSGLNLSFSVMGRITLQGTPAAMTPAGMS
jgi:hypothetical protein